MQDRYKKYADIAGRLADSAKQLAESADLSKLRGYERLKNEVMTGTAQLQNELNELADIATGGFMQNLIHTPQHLARQLKHVDLTNPHHTQRTHHLLLETSQRLESLSECAAQTASSFIPVAAHG